MSMMDNLGPESKTPLPRSNGELVFKEPWESRAFGMAAALADQGVFNWKDFQHGLIAAIAEYEKDRDSIETPYHYYERWFATLEALVVGNGLLSKQDIDALTEDFCKRPHGHDHRHDHDHGHTH